MKTYTESDIRRFHKYIKVGEPSGCWVWVGAISSGRGMFYFNHNCMNAARFMWWITTGAHPGELQVLHSCDNRKCVNPAHLWLGTNADNMQDATEKGRKKGINLGRTNPSAKLTESGVQEIRTKFAQHIARRQLAFEYGVSKVHISNIVKRRNWKHVQ